MWARQVSVGGVALSGDGMIRALGESESERVDEMVSIGTQGAESLSEEQVIMARLRDHCASQPVRLDLKLGQPRQQKLVLAFAHQLAQRLEHRCRALVDRAEVEHIGARKVVPERERGLLELGAARRAHPLAPRHATLAEALALRADPNLVCDHDAGSALRQWVLRAWHRSPCVVVVVVVV